MEITRIVHNENPEWQFAVGERARHFGADLLVQHIGYKNVRYNGMEEYGFFTITFENGDSVQITDYGEWTVILSGSKGELIKYQRPTPERIPDS